MSNEPIDEETTDSIKDLRRAADEGRRAAAEADQLRRELAFARAGIDTESKLGRLLLKTYEGELTAEAIKAEAEELGLLSPQTPAVTQATQVEQDFSRARMDLASEAGTPAANEEDPYLAARQSWETARNEGAPLQDAFAAAMNPLLAAAHRGDVRVSR